jgi:hypothetical protein
VGSASISVAAIVGSSVYFDAVRSFASPLLTWAHPVGHIQNRVCAESPLLIWAHPVGHVQIRVSVASPLLIWAHPVGHIQNQVCAAVWLVHSCFLYEVRISG